MAERKHQDKQERWQAPREDEMHNATLKKRRAWAKEKKAMFELIFKENKAMMMNPTTMGAFKRD
jgi:hypothetical protein